MLYKKAHIENNKIVVDSSKEIDQSALTADCWLIQFDGLSACEDCEFLNTPDCGGQAIRAKLLS